MRSTIAPTMRPAPTLLSLVLVSGLLAPAGGCAYPRRTTHLSPAPTANLSSFDMPTDMWTLRVLDAELPPRKTTGLAWDDDGSGPDAFVRILIDGETLWESPVIEDELQPKWQVTLPNNIVIPDDKTFRIEIWDDDGGLEGDPLGHISRTGLPATARPNAEASLVLNNLATLRITVSNPRPMRGVGLEVEIRPDAMHVVAVQPYSPAQRAELKVGDRIVEIGPVHVSHMADQDALSRLSLASDRAETLVVIDASGTRRQVELDKKPLWQTL